MVSYVACLLCVLSLQEKYKEVVITSDDYTTAPADPVVDKEGFMDVGAAGDIPEELPFN